jgi:hypothetical protein
MLPGSAERREFVNHMRNSLATLVRTADGRHLARSKSFKATVGSSSRAGVSGESSTAW